MSWFALLPLPLGEGRGEGSSNHTLLIFLTAFPALSRWRVPEGGRYESGLPLAVPLIPSPSPKGRREIFYNLVEHALWIIQNRGVGKAQHSQSLRNHVSIAVLIVMPLLIVFMYRAVTFDYQLSLVTIEVHNIISELMLSSKLEPEQLTISE
jgi:hypothetical protein